MELKSAIELINHTHIHSAEKTCWADLGCGNGLFTKALATLLLPGSIIFAVDIQQEALQHLPPVIKGRKIEKIKADFTQVTLGLNQMDGLLMANSLHFVQDKIAFLYQAQHWLKINGVFLIIEYDTDTSNPWVPYPISFRSLAQLFEQTQFKKIEKIQERPSVFNRANIYSAWIQR